MATATSDATTDAENSTLTSEWAHLTGFKRDILLVLAEIAADNRTSYGLAIKRALEDDYAEEVNHGRLYPNLDDLVTAGYVEKSELDKRTNRYELSERGVALLDARAERLLTATE
jgi:DNA-binding PadR family transcriptional regulator